MRLFFRVTPHWAWAGLCLAGIVPSAAWAVPGPPGIVAVRPAPGFVTELAAVSVVFNEPVTGVRADDLLVNGVPAISVTGGPTAYTFGFPQPPFGPVDLTWGALHTITDQDIPPERFDAGTAESVWAYQLTDPAPPAVISILPVPGTVLRSLGQVEVTFDRAVTGLHAPDLLLNGQAAVQTTGVGAGPYRFSFLPAASAGTATLTWGAGHQIASDDVLATAFVANSWKYEVAPSQPPPQVVISEILAENQGGFLDEDKDPEDWIELHNRGTQAVELGGWALSVDREEEGQWVFPPMSLSAGGYLLVWASGKDRRQPGPGQSLHTTFKLNPSGDTLRLFGPELPRTLIDELDYPEQSPNHSYGRSGEAPAETWRYFAQSSPAASNPASTIQGKVAPVHFSVERGFFNAPFGLTLASPTAGAEIRYTLDGSPPTLTNGIIYTSRLAITNTRIVRAAAFAPNQLPSPVRTHTYLMNLANNRRLLPVLSLVTGTNHLYGRAGIMESSPRNTTKHGAAWERPVSVEWIRPEDNGGFQVDAGLRVAGGDYIRQRYNYRRAAPPDGKYSFRLYFRGEYGPGRLEYPIFPASTLDSYNTLHLRAGMNDHSNPFIKDEFLRALTLDVGIPACHGTFVYLFLNGVYKGLYNPCERVDEDFLQAYHGGGELWDVMGPNAMAIRGDVTAWSQLRAAARKDLTIATNYLNVAARMDLANFVDYLLPLIWADNDDWPHNNTRAAREKVPGAKFRFYPWDSEFSFTAHAVSYDTIARTLSNVSPPWGTPDYQAIFNSLKKSPEFRLLFADRVHRAFYNAGPLTDERIRARYNAVKAQAAPSISGFNEVIGTWLTNRRRHLTNIFQRAGFLASSNAPVPSRLGGRVPAGYALSLQNLRGTILYTTNGVDPRVPFSSKPSANARPYVAPLTLTGPLHLQARSLDATNWSALVDLTFEVAQVGSPLRMSEIMFNPPGGDAYEFIEFVNTGVLPVNLSGASLDGVQFRFPTLFPELAPGARLVLASDSRPEDFKRRYPELAVAGWFAGSLANSGERLALIDSAGQTLTGLTYLDEPPWPVEADGNGSSLELIDLEGDPNDPASWQPSLPGGSPGMVNNSPPLPSVLINELQAGSTRDWIELFRPGSTELELNGWSLTDNADPRRFVFPAGTRIPANGFLRIECRTDGAAGALVAPFQLDRDGETLALFDQAGRRVHALSYGPIADGYTLGLTDGQLLLGVPTPLASNQPAPLGELHQVRLNELMANSDAGNDWLELYNAGSLPVNLQGSFIATSNRLARIPWPTFIAPRSVAVLWADEQPEPGHLDLKVPAEGGVLVLLASDGAEVDRVTYGPQPPNLSLGRLPDGTGSLQAFPFSSSPGQTNYLVELGSALRMTEVLAWSSPGPDWVELENVSSVRVALADLSFCTQSPGEPLLRWRLTGSHPLNPGERKLLYFGATPPGFVLPPNASLLANPLSDASATLTIRDPFDRVLDQVEYGPQLMNRSIGRLGTSWTLLGTLSPGQPNGAPATLETGDQLRLNEWLASSQTTADFIEVYNPATAPVDLGGWVLSDDPSIHGSTNQRLAPLTFVGPHAFLRFEADSARQLGPNHTAFALDRLGETIRLLNPSGRIIDTIDLGVQRDAVSEGRYPDGADRIVRFPGSMSPAAANYLRTGDADGDGLDDAWELFYGLDPDWAGDPDLDADGDGLSNRSEFLSGTDPWDNSSMLRLEATIDPEGGPALRFLAQRGRRYLIQAADDLAGAPWLPVTEIAPTEVAREVVVRDPERSTEGERTRFYRLVLAP